MHELDIPETVFEKANGSGIVNVSFKTECGHFCQAFVDRNFKIRGEACADVSLDELKSGNESPEMIQVSDLVVKLASEIIRINVQFNEVIKRMSEQSIVNALEKALLRCQINEVKGHLDLLYAQVMEVGEMEFAVQLRNEIMWLNKLVRGKAGFDWLSIEMRVSPAMEEYEYAHMKGVQYDRLRQIFATLEFEAIEHELPREAVDEKKNQLIDLLEGVD